MTSEIWIEDMEIERKEGSEPCKLLMNGGEEV